ncbi:MAG: hypothetical protein J0J06_13850 [Sphingomonas sp.]|uniref:hypothetical protein n=1 Tax=Sphingomonas sp. TaxID=28214 RepID=UPI001ACAC6C9|nr:hypothetical protein [Sphingomonas sp.]MBN8816518.1 hypothetical protein [Sphingomonas sp.]
MDRLFARGVKDAHLRVFMTCLIIGAPCGIAAFLVSSPYVFLALITLTHFFAFSFNGYAAAMVQLVSPPALRGRMAGLFVLMLIICGNGFGPLSVGTAARHRGTMRRCRLRQRTRRSARSR